MKTSIPSRDPSRDTCQNAQIKNHLPQPGLSIGWTALAGIASLLLASSLFASGFIVCTLRPVSALLADHTIDAPSSPYDHDSLVDMALATRDYTLSPPWVPLDTTSEAGGKAEQALARIIMDHARASSQGNDVRSRIIAERIHEAYEAVEEKSISSGAASTATTTATTMATTTNDWAYVCVLGDLDASVALDSASLAHLADCNRLINAALGWIAASAVGTIVCLVTLRHHRRLLAWACMCAPLLLIVLLALCALWTSIDFVGFFSAFHRLFFPQGNWAFPAQSLLITMLPEGFWMGMAILWLAVSALTCMISLVVGRHLLTTNAR